MNYEPDTNTSDPEVPTRFSVRPETPKKYLTIGAALLALGVLFYTLTRPVLNALGATDSASFDEPLVQVVLFIQTLIRETLVWLSVPFMGAGLILRVFATQPEYIEDDESAEVELDNGE